MSQNNQEKDAPIYIKMVLLFCGIPLRHSSLSKYIPFLKFMKEFMKGVNNFFFL